MTKRVIIVGIPGVGKSTVITNTFNLLSQNGFDAKIAEFGKIMFEQSKLFSINNRDELRKLSIEQQKSLQEMTAKHIFSMNNDIILIDTHLFINTDTGYYPGVPLKLLNILNPTHLILITARSDEIYERRESDTTRQRDLVSISSISNDLDLSKIMISSSSILTGCPFSIIQNNKGQIQRATEEMYKIMIR